MRYSILTFVGLASAAAVTLHADYGYWDVSLNVNSYANGFRSEDIKATYHNSEMSEPVTTSCSYKHDPQVASKEHKSCTDSSFSYSRGLGSEFELVRYAESSAVVSVGRG